MKVHLVLDLPGTPTAELHTLASRREYHNHHDSRQHTHPRGVCVCVTSSPPPPSSFGALVECRCQHVCGVASCERTQDAASERPPSLTSLRHHHGCNARVTSLRHHFAAMHLKPARRHILMASTKIAARSVRNWGRPSEVMCACVLSSCAQMMPSAHPSCHQFVISSCAQ